jgi:hypothetical protein
MEWNDDDEPHTTLSPRRLTLPYHHINHIELK